MLDVLLLKYTLIYVQVSPSPLFISVWELGIKKPTQMLIV